MNFLISTQNCFWRNNKRLRSGKKLAASSIKYALEWLDEKKLLKCCCAIKKPVAKEIKSEFEEFYCNC